MRVRPLTGLLLAVTIVLSPQVAPSRTFPLSGTVVDRFTRAALAGVEVQVSPVGKPDLLESVMTGADGFFEFKNLLQGKYTLFAARAGYVSSGLDEHASFSTGVAVGPGLQSTELIFPLQQKTAIFGAVVDQDGEPVGNASVEAIRQLVEDGLRVARVESIAQTGNDGRYRLSNLTSGLYFLSVTAQPWYTQQLMASGPNTASEIKGQLDAAYPVTYYPGVTSDEAATPLRLNAGARVEANFTLTAVPAAHVTIRRTRRGGVSVRLMRRNHWDLDTTVRALYFSGEQHVFFVAPGVYRLLADWRDQDGLRSMQRMVEASGDVTIDSGSFENQPGLTAVWDGAPSGVHVGPASLALRDLNTFNLVRSRAAGEKRVQWLAADLTGSRYEIVFLGADDCYIDRILTESVKVTGRTIEWNGATSAEFKITFGRGEAGMTGKVDRNGAPAPGAMVLLLRDDFAFAPSLIRRDQSDSDGTFLLNNIVPGRYTLLALPADDHLEYANADVMRPYLSQGKQIEIRPLQQYSETIELITPVR